MGFTIIRESIHSLNTCFKATQNERSRSVNSGFTFLINNVESCCRRAMFSSNKLLFDLKSARKIKRKIVRNLIRNLNIFGVLRRGNYLWSTKCIEILWDNQLGILFFNWLKLWIRWGFEEWLPLFRIEEIQLFKKKKRCCVRHTYSLVTCD